MNHYRIIKFETTLWIHTVSLSLCFRTFLARSCSMSGVDRECGITSHTLGGFPPETNIAMIPFLSNRH